MKQGLWKKVWVAAMLLGLTAPASAKVIQLGDLLAPSASSGESRYVVKHNAQGKFRDTSYRYGAEQLPGFLSNLKFIGRAMSAGDNVSRFPDCTDCHLIPSVLDCQT